MTEHDYHEQERTMMGYRRKVTVDADAPLSDRMEEALRFMARDSGGPSWSAMQIGRALREAGLPASEKSRGYIYSPDSRAATNVLVGLQRRGLAATNGTGGCFVSADWSLTEAGKQRAAKLEPREGDR